MTKSLMDKSADQTCCVTTAELEGLRRVCKQMALLSGTALSGELNSITDIVPVLTSLTDVCGKRLALGEQDQKALRKVREQLVDVEHLKVRFIRNVSHELRTPLASIEGFAKALIQMEKKDNAGEFQSEAGAGQTTRQHFLAIISHEAERLGQLIEDILDLSGFESNCSVQHASLFPTKHLFADVLSSLSSAEGALNVRIRLAPEPDGPMVYADRNSILEVLRQLITNAQKYSQGQEIMLGAEVVSSTPQTAFVSADDSGQHRRVTTGVQIYVKDCGIGISQEELEHIFERFYRGERASRAFPGTGLGLSIVRTLVNQNNGRVWATSEVGKGSTFYVILPNQPPGT